jgi:hypothetical protein
VNRWLALLLAIVAGAVAAYFVTLFTAGALLGILWLYVFGDDPWPAWTDYILGPAIAVAGLLLWAWLSWQLWLRLTRRAS